MARLQGGERTAFLIVDMQNDFLHPQGAYGRNGVTSPAIAALPARHRQVADAVGGSGGWIVSTHFTLVPDRQGEPMMAEHLRALRPFLAKGDFAPGSWGQALIDQLRPAHVAIEKVAYSAFYMSRLEFVLRKAGIEQLIIGGIVTNGGVASTLRDAHVRGFDTILLSDGCAAFSDLAHDATIRALGTISDVMSCAEIVEAPEPADRDPHPGRR